MYNNLQSVEEADRRLQLTGVLQEYLRGFAGVVTRHGVAEQVGTRLLHRHFAVRTAEVVVERPAIHNNKRVLVSSVERTCPDLPPPSSWALEGSTLRELEFSADTAVGREQGVMSDTLRDDWAELVRSFGLHDLLGLALLRRDHLRCDAGDVLVEVSTSDASVVSLEGAGDGRGDDIGTIWAVDLQLRCVLNNHCRKWSTCRRTGTQPYERHEYLYSHDATRMHDHQ